MTLGCRSCHHSIQMQHKGRLVLWCQLKRCEAEKRCNFFVYEPGSDEVEQ